MSIEVSVIVLNFNGKQFLDDCFGSLENQSFDRAHYEILLIDNKSTDGSVAYTKDRWPKVKVFEQPFNRGFAGGINAGVSAASGRIVAFINNDAKADSDWIARGVETLQSRVDIAAVGSKILRLDGKTIDSAGGASSFYGHGFNIGNKEVDQGQFDRASEILFASGCAMFTWKRVFERVGGFDEDFFAFFEDVDLGWRLWLLGYRVVYEPRSVVYHRHHGTMAEYGYERERFLLERNALATVFKNYEEANMSRMLAASVWLAVDRGLGYSTLDSASYDLGRGAPPGELEDEPIRPITAAHLLAVQDLGKKMPSLTQKREWIQANRTRADREIAHLFREPLLPNAAHEGFFDLFHNLTRVLQIDRVFEGQSNVLIITGDIVSPQMAGPAIRAWEMAHHLAKSQSVRLVAAKATIDPPSDFELHVLSHRDLTRHLEWADIVIFQGFILHLYPEVAESGKILVADIYDPFHLENLEMLNVDRSPLDERLAVAESDLNVINQQLSLCDYFICASPKQRDFWLGQLTALGRINLFTYENDPSLQSLVDVVPFGVSPEPPVKKRPVLKGVVDGIGINDKVILWGGGVYNWFDPLTVIRAVDQVRHERPDVKLFFLGMSHPNPDVPKMRMGAEAISLARELGIEGKHVFFNHGWVPYEDRADFLLESDIGVSCHLEHIETTYSFRTRVLDYIWAGLPVIVTRGDSLSVIVEESGLGLTVAPSDVDGFASALIRMLDDEDLLRESQLNIDKIRPTLTWERALQPLEAFCRRPTQASDRFDPKKAGIATGRRRLRGPIWAISRFMTYYKRGGSRLVRRQMKEFLSSRKAG